MKTKFHLNVRAYDREFIYVIFLVFLILFPLLFITTQKTMMNITENHRKSSKIGDIIILKNLNIHQYVISSTVLIM